MSRSKGWAGCVTSLSKATLTTEVMATRVRPLRDAVHYRPAAVGTPTARTKGGTPMSVLDEVLSANDRYATSFGAKSELALPPARQFAILTCMDARLDPAKY